MKTRIKKVVILRGTDEPNESIEYIPQARDGWSGLCPSDINEFTLILIISAITLLYVPAIILYDNFSWKEIKPEDLGGGEACVAKNTHEYATYMIDKYIQKRNPPRPEILVKKVTYIKYP